MNTTKIAKFIIPANPGTTIEIKHENDKDYSLHINGNPDDTTRLLESAMEYNSTFAKCVIEACEYFKTANPNRFKKFE